LGGPIFDQEKLRWLNGLWIREDHDDAALADRLAQWLLNRDNLLKVIPHVKPRMETLSDFLPTVSFLAIARLPLQESSFAANKLDLETQKKILQFAQWQLEAQRQWDRDQIFAALKGLADGMELKLKDFLAPIFIAISGSTASFSVLDAMQLLGPDL